jgi:hypothetical protein
MQTIKTHIIMEQQPLGMGSPLCALQFDYLNWKYFSPFEKNNVNMK